MIAGTTAELAKNLSSLVYEELKTEPFKTLKNRIIAEFEPSNAAKTQEMLKGCELGDLKPMKLLRQKRKLARGCGSDTILRVS